MKAGEACETFFMSKKEQKKHLVQSLTWWDEETGAWVADQDVGVERSIKSFICTVDKNSASLVFAAKFSMKEAFKKFKHWHNLWKYTDEFHGWIVNLDETQKQEEQMWLRNTNISLSHYRSSRYTQKSHDWCYFSLEMVVQWLPSISFYPKCTSSDWTPQRLKHGWAEV